MDPKDIENPIAEADFRNQAEEQNKFDLRELAHYYGGWNELREVIKNLEDNDNEAAYERWCTDYDAPSQAEISERMHKIQRDIK